MDRTAFTNDLDDYEAERARLESAELNVIAKEQKGCS